MALATKVNSAAMKPLLQLHRFSDESAANSIITVTTPVGRVRRILYVTVVYSTSVTEAVTVTLNSGAGANWDTLLQTIVLTAATDGVWIPDGDLFITDDDVLVVTAPAAGGSDTAAIAIYTESL